MHNKQTQCERVMLQDGGEAGSTTRAADARARSRARFLQGCIVSFASTPPLAIPSSLFPLLAHNPRLVCVCVCVCVLRHFGRHKPPRKRAGPSPGLLHLSATHKDTHTQTPTHTHTYEQSNRISTRKRRIEVKSFGRQGREGGRRRRGTYQRRSKTPTSSSVCLLPLPSPTARRRGVGGRGCVNGIKRMARNKLEYDEQEEGG